MIIRTVDVAQPGATCRLRSPLSRAASEGEDIVTLNYQPADGMSALEQKRGWAQFGSSAAVAGLNTVLTLGSAAAMGSLGGALLGPVGAVVGGLVGLVGGILTVAFGDTVKGLDKPFRPLKRAAAQLGARVGGALNAPLQALFPKAVEEFQLSPYSRPFEVSKTDVDNFKSKLQPGDILLTLSNDNPMFHWLVSLKTSALDHTHAALYAGDGMVVEASASTNQVGLRDVDKALAKKAHIVAIRPRYKDDQAVQVVKQAKSYVGRQYDWLASLTDRRLGCVEVPFHSLAKVTIDHDVPVTNLWGIRKFVIPSDFLKTANSDVVAEAGVNRSADKMRLAKYSWAADRLYGPSSVTTG